MFQPPPRRCVPHVIISDAQIVATTVARCLDALQAQTTHLGTANKNRVLLTLHQHIGEQLDSLAANNDQ